MRQKFRILATAFLATIGLLAPQAAFATTIDVGSSELNFGATSGTDQPTHIGVNVPQGFTHRYDDVFAGVDAVATLVNVTNINSGPNTDTVPDGLVDYFDESSSSTGKSINIDIDIFGASGATETGFVTFRIDFVAADTNNAVTLQNIAMTVKDIDSRQYASFAGISNYRLSRTVGSPVTINEITELTTYASGGVYEFAEPAGNSSIPDDEENWVSVDYASASTITITLGARESGGASFEVSFVDATWPATPVSTAVPLTAYSLTYDGNSATSGAVPATQNSNTSSASVVLAAAQGTLLKTTCTLNGWNTRSDGTGANYLDTGTISLTANTTLFANWSCTTPVVTPAATPVVVATLATTGWDATSAWMIAGSLVFAGISLIRSRKLLTRKI
jgi:hypothetical protein